MVAFLAVPLCLGTNISSQIGAAVLDCVLSLSGLAWFLGMIIPFAFALKGRTRCYTYLAGTE